MTAESIREIDRLQGSYGVRQVLGVDIPEIYLPVAAGRNLAVLLECAVRNHSLRIHGYNAADDFCAHQHRAMMMESQTEHPIHFHSTH
jgi:HPr kinase/phosphorylase